jgi:hypothetical protein
VAAGIVALLASCTAPAERTPGATGSPFRPDPGGESVDLSRTGPEAVAVVGADVLTNGGFEAFNSTNCVPVGWRYSGGLHTPDAELKKVLEPKLMPLLGHGVANDRPASGSRFIRVTTPAEVHRIRGHRLPLISNGFVSEVALPELAGPTRFRLRMSYRGQAVPGIPGGNNVTLLIACRDGTVPAGHRKDTRPMVNHALPPSRDWTRLDILFSVPRGTRHLSVMAKFYGCGEADFDEMQLHRVADEPGVTVRMMPLSFLDNVFCLVPDRPGILVLPCRNTAGTAPVKPRLHLELPTGVRLLDARRPLTVEPGTPSGPTGATHHTIVVDRGTAAGFAAEDYASWPAPSLLIASDLPAGAERTARYWYSDGAYVSAARPFTVRMIPPVEGRRPRRFETGVVFAREADYASPAAAEALASYYAALGFNAVHHGNSTNLLQALGARGVRRYCQPGWLVNGYRLGQGRKPEGVQFKKADGTAFNRGDGECLCPVEAIAEGPYFREHVVAPLRRLLVEERTADSIMANWEPYMFDNQGCFCPRCRAEFARESGMPEAGIERLWTLPAGVSRGEAWVKFRSRQHARLVATLDRTVHALGREAGIDAHFAPEIAWSALTPDGNADFAQYNPVDYLDQLPLIEPWGPYVFQPLSMPFVRGAGAHLATFEAGRAIREFVAASVPEPTRRPRMIAFPHGFQLNDWVTTPEAIAFENLCFFLNRWNGALVYYFPRGYDARYWNALAAANATIADWEDFVFDGKPVTNFRVQAESPLPETAADSFGLEGRRLSALPSLAGSPPLVQGLAFERDGRRLVAVGNFWEQGETFARLSVDGLAENRTYSLREPGMSRCFTAPGGGTGWTAQELKEGALVHVGALRFAFFLVEPFRPDSAPDTPVSQAAIRACLESRLPALRKALP